MTKRDEHLDVDDEILDGDDEALVAYLDGELERDQRGELEQRLVHDEALRVRLQSLQRGWDLLDLLPSPVTTEQSVQSTMELVVADVQKSLTNLSADFEHQGETGESFGKPISKPAAKPKWPRLLRMIVVPLLLATVAYLGVRGWYSYVANDEVRDFPVAIDMDAYALADKTKLIDDLVASPRWRSVVVNSVVPEIDELIRPVSTGSTDDNGRADDEQADRDGDVANANSKLGTPALSTNQELASALEEIAPEQRLIALSRIERFEQLDDAAKASLRDRARELSQAPDAAQRLEVLRDYARWREQLSDEAIMAIESSEGEARQMAIDEAMTETITALGRVTGRSLSEDAIERIDFTIIQIVKNRIQDELAKPEDERSTFVNERVLRMISQGGRRGSSTMYRTIASGYLFRKAGGSGEPLNSDELDMIEAMLPEKDANMLQGYVADPWVRSLILEDWAEEAVRRKMRGRTSTPSLPDRYESLPKAEREVMDLMSPEKARQWLIESK
ncbi:hypothetical protein SAMN06265222_12432 [Neorhodopirellula lusitana]|uniref:Uncharacterized protein n=1 Tax=Neorhodopirellula lusitana TaxID=445327 RepID=A0ABY1QQC2_9BACT|nr:hypothetical protein [Neorhodopirellula lusitana]SMP78023.1 hypothetical protein SAMN06265222_12432 [Neorhodopirellula lusitana]